MLFTPFLSGAPPPEKNSESAPEYIVFNKRNLVSRTAITQKFKMLWFKNEARYWASKLQTDLNLAPLMPDEDKNSLSFGFWKMMTSRENDLYQNALVLLMMKI